MDLHSIFDINTFNVLSDGEYYYFFRALNNADNYQLENHLITDENGNIQRINTDLSRFDEDPKYKSIDEISLEQMVDHIKMHYRKDTNCISLSSNANASITYGRGYYKDRYIIVKVKKEELGVRTYNAGAYMLAEINKKIEEIIESNNIDRTIFDKIDNATSTDEIINVLNGYFSLSDFDLEIEFEKGINYTKKENSLTKYQTLSEKQNLQKNKIMAKLKLINSNIIPNMSNEFLMGTIGNAFSSLELIHYKEIVKEEIIDIPKEIVDIFSLLQQLPKNYPLVDKLKKELISYINAGDFSLVEKFKYDENILHEELSIEDAYILTNGEASYNDINNLYIKSYYLAKAKLRCMNSLKLLKKIVLNDSEYQGLFNYISDFCYGIEPQIVLRKNNRGLKISESVNLDISSDEYKVLEKITKLSSEELINILNNPKASFNYFDNPKKTMNISKNIYYANAIIDLFDWNKLNITSFDSEKRMDIINKLVENNIVEMYWKIKHKGIKDKNISNMVLTALIKNKNIDEIDDNDTFDVSQLEDFLGYYRIKKTKLKLRGYQAKVLKEINRNLINNKFTTAILPTGSGKSYITLAKMLEYKNKNILYLAPNEEILNQMKRLIRDTMYGKDMRKSLDNIVKEVFPNLTLTTYQSLLTDFGEKYINKKYDFIVFDELHRVGAKEWSKKVDILINNNNDSKYLGITATPQRDADLVDMSNKLAQKLGYTKEEIENEKHLSANLDLITAIKAGYVINPKVVSCEYSLMHDGTLEGMLNRINNIRDNEKRKFYLNKFDQLRKNISNAQGISEILVENLKLGGKYIVFLPINRKDNGTYEDTDGNQISDKKAEMIIKAYQNQMFQYMFTGEYLKKNKEYLYNIYYKILNNIALTNEEMNFLNKEKDNILLLTRIKNIRQQDNPISKENDIAELIIKYMNWKLLKESEKEKLLRTKTKDLVNCYSMLGSYSSKHNDNQLMAFEHDDSNKYKFMLVMNKLNEGSHISGINGLIWFRSLNENSKILFLQQFGRIIFSKDPNKQYSEKDRTIAIDLVNNILRVNLNKNQSETKDDLEILKLILDWCKTHGNQIPDINSQSKLESRYALFLKKIQEKYKIYIENRSLYDNLKEEKKYVDEILNLGSQIDLWNIIFENKISETSMINANDEFSFEPFELTAILKDYVDLEKDVREIDNSKDNIIMTVKDIMEYCDKYEQWPKKHIYNEISNHRTSEQLANWLTDHNYNRDGYEFDYRNIEFEDGRMIEEVLDDLRKQCSYIKNGTDEYVHSMVEAIISYCEKYHCWPINAENDKSSDGFVKSGAQLARWLRNHKYNDTEFEFEYKNYIFEEEKTVEAVLDELRKKYLYEKRGSEKAILLVINNIKEYCETYYEWPIESSIKEISNKKTGKQLASWLAKNKHKLDTDYGEIIYENRKTIKEVLDELRRCYYVRNREDVLIMLQSIKEYCDTYEEWPCHSAEAKNRTVSSGKTIEQIMYWLDDHNYNKKDAEFDYKDIIFKPGITIKDFLDELFKKYEYVKRGSKESVISIVDDIKYYCENYHEWPNYSKEAEDRYIPSGKSSKQLIKWIGRHYQGLSYNSNDLDYSEYSTMMYDSERTVKEVLDELYRTYAFGISELVKISEDDILSKRVYEDAAEMTKDAGKKESKD